MNAGFKLVFLLIAPFLVAIFCFVRYLASDNTSWLLGVFAGSLFIIIVLLFLLPAYGKGRS
jgi:hypothetical protein